MSFLLVVRPTTVLKATPLAEAQVATPREQLSVLHLSHPKASFQRPQLLLLPTRTTVTMDMRPLQDGCEQ